MAATGARIEAYSYADNSGRWISTRQIGVDLGAGVVYVRHSTPMRLEDQLAAWQAALDASAPGGAPWALSYSSATQRVTIASAGAAFDLTLSGSVGAWLGLTAASYLGAATYTGDAAPAGLLQCLAVDSTVAQAHERIEQSEYRHGRAVATVWGKIDRFKVTAWVRRDQYPWQAATGQGGDDSPRGGWVTTGRVRVHQSGGSGSQYSSSAIDGYIDGFVVSCTAELDREDDGLLRLDMLVVAPPRGTGAAEPTGFWGAVKYGWNPDYCLTIAGVPVVWCERETGKTLAAGYTESAALVIDDSAAVGSLIDRDRGIGIGLSLGFKILDTAAIAAYMRRPAATTYLTATLSATEVGSVHVDSTAGFAGAGAIFIGAERIEYTATTGTTFDNLTRGAKGTRYSKHAKGGGGQVVTDTLRWWQGRDVLLSAVPVDPSGYVTGTAISDDEVQIWRGRLAKSPLRSFDGWQFDADALDRVLDTKLAAKLTGKVVAFESGIVVQAAWSIKLKIDGVDAVGNSVWASGPYTLDLQPFSAYNDGDVVSAGEARSAIDTAWAAAITALGAGADLGSQLYWTPNLVGGWVAQITIKANAAVVNVLVFASEWFGAVPTVPKSWPPQPSNAVDWLMHAGWSTQSDVISLAGGPASKPPVVVEMDDALAADVPTDGFIRVKAADKSRIFQYTAALASGSYLYLPYLLPADKGPMWQAQSDWAGVTVELWALDGPADLPVLMLDAIESSGAGVYGSYDVLSHGSGYGIEWVDEASFTQKSGFFGLKTAVSAAGSSFADLFGGALALCRSAVVQRSDTGETDLAVGLALVETAPDGSDWQTEITDYDLLHLNNEPVSSVQRLDPPNAIKTTRIIADGGDTTETVEASDYDQIAARGRAQADWQVPADSRQQLADLLQIRAPQHFAAEQDAQAIVLRIPPWVDAEPGDLVRLTDLTHPSIYDYGTASQGYDGTARITGRALSLKDCTVEVTAILAGQFRALSLCPSMRVGGWAGAAGAPTTIDVPLKYLPHAAKALSEAGGDITSLHYHAGDGEGTGERYSISAAAEVAGVCRLTVAAQVGVFSLTTANSYLTLPPVGAFGATVYQDGFAHADDGSNWI